MATTRKILGQSVAAAAAGATVLYQPAAATDAVVSTIVVCETNGVAATFKLATNPTALGTVAAANAVAFNMPIPANGTITLTLGITLQAAAQICHSASTVNVTFTAYGQENT